MCGAFLLAFLVSSGDNSRKGEVKLLSLSFGSTGRKVNQRSLKEKHRCEIKYNVLS